MKGKAVTELKPVLAAIRALLKLKDSTTYTEVAKVAGVKPGYALTVIHRNGNFVWRTAAGKITRVDPRSELRERLWRSGRYYRVGTYDWGSTQGFEFHNPELYDRLKQRMCDSGHGDHPAAYVPHTPENEKALHDAGLRPWEEAVIDDRLWVEPVEEEKGDA